jgi:hypothetical protein
LSFCLRLDLDVAPESGVEAAIVARLLKLSRDKGYVYHFFATRRALEQLFVLPEVLVSEGHALGALCRDKRQLDRRWPGLSGLAVDWAWEGGPPADSGFVVAPGGGGPRVYVSTDLAGSQPGDWPGIAVLRSDVTALARSDGQLRQFESEVDRWLTAKRPMVILPVD